MQGRVEERVEIALMLENCKGTDVVASDWDNRFGATKYCLIDIRLMGLIIHKLVEGGRCR